MLRIVDFTMEHAGHFKALNEAWITRYFEMEESDRKMLDNPKSYILDPGGAILIALLDEQVVGTCALLKLAADRYELAKMAVSPAAQGKSIGYQLGLRTLDKARELHARSVYLETNARLEPAIALYKKLGFQEVSKEDSPYQRCDVQMELVFSNVL